jgi:hypothetical protein
MELAYFEHSVVDDKRQTAAALGQAHVFPVYIWACHDNKVKAPWFDEPERALMIAILAISCVAIYAFTHGLITL